MHLHVHVCRVVIYMFIVAYMPYMCPEPMHKMHMLYIDMWTLELKVVLGYVSSEFAICI